MNTDSTELLISKANVRYMSNAKWKKLFLASESFGGLIGGVVWKIVGSDSTFINSLNVSDLLENNAYFGDCLPSPYLDLKSIESIFIPRSYSCRERGFREPLQKVNDLKGFKAHLESYGNFPVFESADGLEIRGYDWD